MARTDLPAREQPGDFSGGTSGWTWGERAALVLGALLRLALPVAAWLVSRDLSVFHSPDDSYLLIASALLRGEGFSLDGVPELVRTPGYPVFLAPGVLAGAVEPLTVFLQAIAGTITVGLVIAVTKGLTSSRRASVAAGFAYAVEPLAIVYTSKLSTESLFAMFLMLAALILQRSLRRDSWTDLVGGAVALSLAAYVRPIGYFLPVVTTATWLVVAAVGKPVSRVVLARVAVFLAVTMSVLGLWQTRNFLAAGYSRFSAVTDLALYAYHGAAVQAAVEGASYYDVRDRMLLEAESSRDSAPSQGAYYRSLGIVGERLVASRPWVFLSTYLKGVMRVALDPGGIEYLKLFGVYPQSGGLLGVIVDKGVLSAILQLFRDQPGALLVMGLLGLLLGLYWVMAAVGAGIVVRERPLRVDAALMLAWPAYLILVSGGPAALDRFRHPAMPFVAVLVGLAAEGIEPVWRRLGRALGRNLPQ